MQFTCFKKKLKHFFIILFQIYIMKFNCNIDINKPITDVVMHFQDPEALKNSQKGFLRIEHLSGIKGEDGAKSKLIYKKFDLIETIIHNTLPDEFYAKYEHKHMTNTMRTKFNILTKHKTRLIVEVDYIVFRGIVIKIIAKIFPNIFKKQINEWLIKFKAYSENQ